jgi:hypothetical protein
VKWLPAGTGAGMAGRMGNEGAAGTAGCREAVAGRRWARGAEWWAFGTQCRPRRGAGVLLADTVVEVRGTGAGGVGAPRSPVEIAMANATSAPRPIPA